MIYYTRAMTIHIPISADTEAKLREHALAAGKDITSFILEVLEEKFSETASPGGPSSDPARLLQGLDPDVWKGIDPVDYQRGEREGWE